MDRAIAAARRASTIPTGPPTAPSGSAVSASCTRRWRTEREEIREQLILEVGCPRMLTFGPQLDAPLDGRPQLPGQLIDEFGWETDLPDAPDFRGTNSSRRIVKEPVGCGREPSSRGTIRSR